jgi:hypothetical protein
MKIGPHALNGGLIVELLQAPVMVTATGVFTCAVLGETDIVVAFAVSTAMMLIRRATSQKLTVIRFILILLKTKRVWKWI